MNPRVRAAIAVALAAAGCRAKTPPPPSPPVVVVVTVAQEDVPVLREWIGTTEGDVTAQIRPKVDGYVLRRAYTEGGFVHKGDLLFEVDPRQTQAQLEQAQANLEQGKAGLAKARLDVERARPLAEQHAISRQELDNAVAAEHVAQAAVGAAQAAVERARLDQGWAKVTSPIAGIAGLAQAQVGELVGPQSVLTTVSTVDPIRVLFKIGEPEYMQYQAGAAANGAAGPAIRELELVLSDGSTFPHRGRLLLADREVDVRTGSITLVGTFRIPTICFGPANTAACARRWT